MFRILINDRVEQLLGTGLRILVDTLIWLIAMNDFFPIRKIESRTSTFWFLRSLVAKILFVLVGLPCLFILIIFISAVDREERQYND